MPQSQALKLVILIASIRIGKLNQRSDFGNMTAGHVAQIQTPISDLDRSDCINELLLVDRSGDPE